MAMVKHRYPVPSFNAASVKCPVCSAPVDMPCVSPSYEAINTPQIAIAPAPGPHDLRVMEAALVALGASGAEAEGKCV